MDVLDAVRGVLGMPPRTPAIRNSLACRLGEHDACGGEGWDVVNDVPAHCLCDCHVEEAAA